MHLGLINGLQNFVTNPLRKFARVFSLKVFLIILHLISSNFDKRGLCVKPQNNNSLQQQQQQKKTISALKVTIEQLMHKRLQTFVTSN